jgi:hypothetical protein
MARKLLPADQADPGNRKYIQDIFERDEEIAEFVIIVTSEYQKNRYRQAFERKNAEVLIRTKDRKIKIREDHPRWSPRDFFGDSVMILTLDEALGTGI